MAKKSRIKKSRINKYRINKKTKKNYRKAGTRRSTRGTRQPDRYEPEPNTRSTRTTRNRRNTRRENPNDYQRQFEEKRKAYDGKFYTFQQFKNEYGSNVRRYWNQADIERRRDVNQEDPTLSFTLEEFINYYGEQEGERLWGLNKKPISIIQARNAEMNRNENTGYHYQPTSVFYTRHNQNTGENENVYYNQYEMDVNRENDNILREWLQYNELPYPRNVRKHQQYLRQALYEYRHRNVY